MTEKEFLNFVAVAAKGKHTKFELIKSLDGWLAARVVKRVLKKTIKAFKVVAKSAVDLYIEQLDKGDYNIQLFEAAIAYKKYVEFYKKELATMNNMLDEFYCYFFNGHILYTLFGGKRHNYDLIDYRILTKNLKDFK